MCCGEPRYGESRMPGSGSEMWETALEDQRKTESSLYAPTLDFHRSAGNAAP